MEKFYLVTYSECVISLKTYLDVKKLSATEKCSLLINGLNVNRRVKVFHSKKDAVECYREYSKIFNKDFSPTKNYVVIFGIFMEQKAVFDRNRFYRSILKQRISRPLSAKEMKVLEDLQND